jgi:hypothetical protein
MKIRESIDFKHNEEKATRLFNQLIKDKERKAELWKFEIENKVYWSVFYFTRKGTL